MKRFVARGLRFALALVAALPAMGSEGPAAPAHGAAMPGLSSVPCLSPTAPVRIELVAAPSRKGDARGQRRLKVEVMPRVSAPWLEVTLSLPPGVTLVEGESRWRLPARAGMAQTRELLLQVPSTGERRVVAAARLVFRWSLPMAGATSYTFNAAPEPRPDRPGALEEPATLPTIPTARSR